MIDRTTLSLRALATQAIRSARQRVEAPAERAESAFERQLRRMGILPGRSEPATADAAAPAERIGIGRLRDLAAPGPSAPEGGARKPLGATPSRRAIGGAGSGGGSPAPGGDGPPIRLTSAGGYRSEDDYLRAKPWESNPDALFPDPSLAGFWVDPATGSTGTFPSGYVPGEPIGRVPGAPPTDASPAPEPPPDLIAEEMTRLGLDPSDPGERLRFEASIDPSIRQWINRVLEGRDLDPVEERPLEELSPELSAKLKAKREREAQQHAIVADLNRPGGPQHGSLKGGPPESVPIYEPA